MLLQNQKFFEGSIGASLLNRIELDNRLVGALSELVERRDCQVEGVIPQLLKRIPNLGVFA
jgi:hypothetical protein